MKSFQIIMKCNPFTLGALGSLLLAAYAPGASFTFSTGAPDGKIATLSRPSGPGRIQTETADDFVVTQSVVISQATFTGLLPLGTPLGNVRNVEIEIYHVFPGDSDTNRTLRVPTRANSPGDVEIEDDDLQVDTYRASGAGGQHVNKTDSAVRITHKPSGIVVQCQNERSQSANRDTAMRMLRAKLLEREERRRREEIAREKGDAQDVNFGSQIRSYVLHPYTMVKDHRTNTEVGDAQRVLDGDLDAFVRAGLLRIAGHA